MVGFDSGILPSLGFMRVGRTGRPSTAASICIRHSLFQTLFQNAYPCGAINAITANVPVLLVCIPHGHACLEQQPIACLRQQTYFECYGRDCCFAGTIDAPMVHYNLANGLVNLKMLRCTKKWEAIFLKRRRPGGRQVKAVLARWLYLMIVPEGFAMRWHQKVSIKETIVITP
jgi:hypothetical protein